MSTAQRLSTAQRQVNTNGVGLQNSVKVQGRPVTGQGMSGIQTRAGTAGPRRTIQDSSYYVSALTSKNTELQTEIRKMQNEIDAHEKDGNLYKRLEKKYETLIDEVRELEGTLADYNLAKDKARMTTDPQQIKNFQMQLKEKNANFEREADNVYRMKQAQIAKTAELKERIDDIKREEAAKIEELGFEEKNRFLALQEEKESAQVRIDQGKAKMEDMKRHIKRLEDDIKFNTYINEYVGRFQCCWPDNMGRALSPAQLHRYAHACCCFSRGLRGPDTRICRSVFLGWKRRKNLPKLKRTGSLWTLSRPVKSFCRKSSPAMQKSRPHRRRSRKLKKQTNRRGSTSRSSQAALTSTRGITKILKSTWWLHGLCDGTPRHRMAVCRRVASHLPGTFVVSSDTNCCLSETAS